MVAAVLVLLALSMFGLYDIRMPGFLMQKELQYLGSALEQPAPIEVITPAAIEQPIHSARSLGVRGMNSHSFRARCSININ